MAKDSLTASEILKKNVANTTSVVKLNPNGLKLDLTKKDATKIAKIALYATYGKFHIWKQKPFHVFKIENYWIMWGYFKHEKKRCGGVFEIVINTQNGCVEYLSHGK
jgi:hypothetical protein